MKNKVYVNCDCCGQMKEIKEIKANGTIFTCLDCLYDPKYIHQFPGTNKIKGL
jgi:uncharacterized Zn finger protein